MEAEFLLIRRMKQGREAAMEEFVRRYYPEVLRYCAWHCSDRQYAEDMTQETFVRFFSQLPAFRYEGKTKNYLYVIAGNLCRDHHKKKKDMLVEAESLTRQAERAAEQAGQHEPLAETAVNRIVIEQALQQLPDDWREIVILHYFQELKLTEVAGILQIGLPLVKYRLRQARKRLQALLAEEQETAGPCLERKEEEKGGGRRMLAGRKENKK